MELIVGVLVLAGVYLGFRMGKGDTLELQPIKMKRAVRSEIEEAELEKKLKNEYKPRR